MLRQIELYLDGELEVSATMEIQRHLDACPPCWGHSEFRVRLREVVRTKCGCDVAPEHLAQRVRAMLEGPGDPPLA